MNDVSSRKVLVQEESAEGSRAVQIVTVLVATQPDFLTLGQGHDGVNCAPLAVTCARVGVRVVDFLVIHLSSHSTLVYA